MSILYKIVIKLILIVLVPFSLYGQENEIPFTVKPLFDLSQPAILGLPSAKNAETFTIFSPENEDNKYNHGVVLFPFKGMLYLTFVCGKIVRLSRVIPNL